MKILAAGLTLIAAAVVCVPAARAAEAAVNVVLIIGDDQGSTDFGFMGHPVVRTPHLDRLAGQSLVFPRGFVPTSLCCPSLATIITGKYPHQHGVTSNDPPAADGPRTGRGSSAELTAKWNAALDHTPTLPRLLAGRGYLSFQTGKWWHGDFSRGGFTHGMTKGSRHGDAGLTIGREGLQPIADFLDEAEHQKKPFFVWYAPFMPHTPHTPPDRLFQKYAGQTPSAHIARYWAMCEWYDETVGELMALLQKRQLENNTLVICLTDNGWVQSPDRAAFAPKNKTTPFDRGHRTPILVRWPGRVAPRRSEQLASSIDILPTVLTAAGIEPPADTPGLNLLDESRLATRKHVFGECFTVRSQSLENPADSLLWRWVTDGRQRLIVPRTCEADPALARIPADSYLTPDLIQTLKDARPMLFDLADDPGEDRNLAEAQRELAGALRAELDRVWIPRTSVSGR